MIPAPWLEILELARWAPSGDNSQPWRFDVIDERHLVVHAFDTRTHCVYDLDGHSSQLAHGALLETLAMAASVHGLRLVHQRRPGLPDNEAVYDVKLNPDSGIKPDPLQPYITRRTVQRRTMQTRPLTVSQKNALQDAVGERYSVRWFEKDRMRWRFAKLMFDNAKIRLTVPEAYQVHRDIIEWDARFSEDRVPDQALGLDSMTRKLMRWVMASWSRVRFFNRYLAGHLIPRLEMDLLPGMLCAGHFVLIAKHPPTTVDDYVDAGRMLQRFWLTATSAGLQLQPEMTPLIFSRYVYQQRKFSENLAASKKASDLARRLSVLLGNDAASAMFMGRIGHGRAATSRSLRLPLRRLMRAHA